MKNWLNVPSEISNQLKVTTIELRGNVIQPHSQGSIIYPIPVDLQGQVKAVSFKNDSNSCYAYTQVSFDLLNENFVVVALVVLSRKTELKVYEYFLIMS